MISDMSPINCCRHTVTVGITSNRSDHLSDRVDPLKTEVVVSTSAVKQPVLNFGLCQDKLSELVADKVVKLLTTAEKYCKRSERRTEMHTRALLEADILELGTMILKHIDRSYILL